MKIIDLLLEHLPDAYIDAIHSNMHDPRGLYDESICIEVDLLTLFDWEETPQGYEFWEQVLESIVNGTDLPPLPTKVKYYPSTYIVGNNKVYIMNVGNSSVDISFRLNLKELEEYNQLTVEKFYTWVN